MQLIIIIIFYLGIFMLFRSLMVTTLLATAVASPLLAAESVVNNSYSETVFVANKAGYGAEKIDDKLINAWGIAIRPAGAGGHFWVAGKDISFEYVGDVSKSPDPKLQKLHTDKLEYVKLPVGGDDKFATGIVFNDSKDTFVITQTPTTGEVITAPAKFLFASDGGVISAWTERKKEDGSFDRPVDAQMVIDKSKQGAQFFGLAINADYSKIYAANFGENAGVEVFDGKFKPAKVKFAMPFDENKNGKVDAGEYAPFNVQALKTPKGENHIFVTYAKTQSCPVEEVAKNTCKKGAIFAGEEDTSKPGQGRLAEFTEDGKLVAKWNDGGKLSAPWGIAYAPADFGALSNALLVGNFGDGTIAAYDAASRKFIDNLKDKNGKPVIIEKLWGILFGNGASLGDTNALYFAAGPNDEKDGLFGVLRPVKNY
jgi:uncharacterized protein (TIGR03118 family)